jgi:Uma2 family endonuclease
MATTGGFIFTPAAVRSGVKVKSMAALVEDLGGVPLDRVLVEPPPGLATEKHLLRFVEVDKLLVELVDGTLVEKPVGFTEDRIGMEIAFALMQFVRPRNLGVVAGPTGPLRMSGGNIRLPDVTFVAWSDVPGGVLPKEPVPRLPPTIAVEVLSPSNTKAEMVRKRREYFASGTKRVWEIDPSTRSALVYRPAAPDDPQVLTESQAIEGEDVIPGFQLSLRDLFAEPTPSSP